VKQNITVEQLNELSKEQKDKLFRWMYSVKMETPCIAMSIGQMIEFLEEHDGIPLWERLKMISDSWKTRNEELCDALWEAVKEVLND
jgi:hypothetical protein